jgi:hypothetical protein
MNLFSYVQELAKAELKPYEKTRIKQELRVNNPELNGADLREASLQNR